MNELLLIAATERELCPAPGARSMCCGIGPVEAGLTTLQALAEAPAPAILHVGIAGAVSLAPGSIVIGSSSVYVDILDEHATFPRVSRLEPDARMLQTARRALPDALVSAIATTGRVGGASDHAIEAMEGFAVLRAAELAGVPAIEVRVISNSPVDVDRTLWRTEDALEVLHATIRTLIPALRECLT